MSANKVAVAPAVVGRLYGVLLTGLKLVLDILRQGSRAGIAGDGAPSITTTLPQFGQFLGGNCFAEGKATKLSSVWSGRHEEVLKVP